MRITVYAECISVFIKILFSSLNATLIVDNAECISDFIKILFSSLNATLIVDKHCSNVCCDKFPVQQTDRKIEPVKEHSDTKNCICNHYGEKLSILDT